MNKWKGLELCSNNATAIRVHCQCNDNTSYSFNIVGGARNDFLLRKGSLMIYRTDKR